MQKSFSLTDVQKKFFDYTNDAVLVTDFNGNIWYVNKAFLSLSGFKSSEVINKNFVSLNCGNPLTFHDIVRVLSIHHILLDKFDCKNSAGNPLKLAASFSFLKEPEKGPTGVLIVLRNDKPESEEDRKFLQEHGNLLSSLSFRSDEFYMIYDIRNWRNIYCGENVENILGWSSSDFVNGSWAFSLATTHPDDMEILTVQYRMEIEKRRNVESRLDETPFTFEYRKSHKNGNWKWLRTESTVLNRDKNGELRYILNAIKDIGKERLRSGLKRNQDLEEILRTGLEHLHFSSVRQATGKAHSAGSTLTSRESEILKHVKTGMSTKEIAEKLSLTVHTINTYRKNIMIKLHARNTAELVKIAMEYNLG
jgi:PAS domain S-box-containing protein